MSHKILVVDDDENAASILQIILEDEGFNPVFARNGRSALEMVKSEKPSLILLDIMMPDMNGYEVCEKIKADPETMDIPVIMLTAKDMGEDVELALSKKVDWYIAKPYDNRYLVSKINSFLKK